MPLPALLTTVVLIVSLACSLAWGKPPVKPQKGNIAHTNSTQQQEEDETISVFLPSVSGMETDLASTLFSNLWTHSTVECLFPPSPQPSPQPCADSQPGKQLTQAGKLKDHSQRKLQDKNSGHPTTQTTVASSGWNGLKLDTVIPADRRNPFPDLTPVALERLMQLSPTINRLHQHLQTGIDPLAGRDDLKAFINKIGHNQGELFATGNHSLVIKWRRGPGYVLKIARSRQDSIRLTKEQNLYLWLREPDKFLLNLTTTPMRASFSIHGKPVLALRQVDSTARDRLRLMREHHSLNERLDFALSVIFHFCQMYRRFLEKNVLLADRHDDNIGFNAIPLPATKGTSLDDAILQVPVMLDLDPYWFGDQEVRDIQLHLPTWIPVMIGLFEEVFTPRDSTGQISQSRVAVIDQIRKLASPVFSSSSSSPVLTETTEEDIETALQSCITHWFQEIDPQYSELLAEARSHIEPLLASLKQWDSAPRTVAEWNIKLQEEMRQALQWLNSWKNATEFSLLKEYTDQDINRAPSAQGGASPREQQILTLLSMIHGKLGCQKCSRTFATSTEFTRHRQHHQQNRLKHCNLCGGDFTCISMHERVHTGEKPYKCEHCDRCFSRNSSLCVHLRTHSGDKPYQCEHCGKCFAQHSTLRGHLRVHSGDRPFQCEHCGKCFAQRSTLRGHLRIHSGDKSYKCEHCEKCFLFSGSLKKHLFTHSDDKPYKCEQCGKGFAQSSALHVHMRTHSGDKPYKCEHCDKCFSHSGVLKAHIRTHTTDKPYRCEHCDKAFSKSGNLQNHLRTHSGEKPYSCEHCGKCFSQSSNLKRHLLTHSGEKSFKCEHCGKCFFLSSDLKRHLRTHSGDKS